MGRPSVGEAVRRRPRDRKDQLASTAARLFAELGYHRVAMEDIASAVGVTSRAIYRHFGNKQDLLVTTVLDAHDALEACLQGGLDETLIALATATVERRDVGVLVQREARHLAGSAAARRRRTFVERLRTLLRAARPDLDADDAELLAQCVLAVVCSPSFHTAVLPRGRAEELVAAMCASAVRTGALPRKAAASSASPGDWLAAPRASRREAVLAAAIELFAERGYAAVRMEDVGAVAGIAGPSIYQHFDSKTDLLMAALTRGAEWLQLGIVRALAPARSSSEALALVVRSYVEFLLGHTELMTVFLTETTYLPEHEQHVLRRVQHEYVAEWIRLLVDVRPELGDAEARFLVHGVLAIANDTARNGRGRERPDFADLLVEIGIELLGIRR